MSSTTHRSVTGFVVLAVCLAAPLAAFAQWQVQDSHSAAGLRGVHAVSLSVAWASGTDGTVLRTQDGGAHWQRCATPAGAEKLDFRGVWAWSAEVAMIMSSGPGDLSRVYLTNDGCAHWAEYARNTEKDGFWDAIAFTTASLPPKAASFSRSNTGILVGDPVRGRFAAYTVAEGNSWQPDEKTCAARDGEGGFAASNSMAFAFGPKQYLIVTGGKGGPRALLSPLLAYNDSKKDCLAVDLPLIGGADASGAFSVSFRDRKHGVVVGGDYTKPNDANRTAAWTDDGGHHWTAAIKPPHGYRSAVAWYPKANAWIAVGTNGSDISRDDGKTWQHLDDGKWNALSPPFVVGPAGRIGRIQPDQIPGKRQ